ncbi:MAG: isochorismatase family protein [Candidatus Micrarchaeaceae archaeon]
MENAQEFTILVIDPQKGWINEHTEKLFENIWSFISNYELSNRTVITTFANTPKSKFRKLLPWWDGFMGKTDTQIVPPFAESQIPVFKRKTYGMPQSLWRELRLRKVDELLITGVETDASVIKTAMDAFDRGINSWIIAELVGSTYGEQGQKAGLEIARKVLGNERVCSSVNEFLQRALLRA